MDRRRAIQARGVARGSGLRLKLSPNLRKDSAPSQLEVAGRAERIESDNRRQIT